MRIFFSVGEPSGDLHASNLICRLRSQVDSIECVGFGGPKMAEAGCDIHYDLTQQAVMFLFEAIKRLRFFLKLVDRADEYFANNKIDAVVLIDFSGFNWHIAKRAKKHGIPVFYYGVPQVWAWGQWRVRKIRSRVDHVLCKLPFEVPWFAERGINATYIGHPYFDQLESQQYDQQFLADFSEDERPLLTLLPGSRTQEVKYNLPMLVRSARKVARQVPNVRIAVACYDQRLFDLSREVLADQSNSEEHGPVNVELFAAKTPELMKAATACMACSGSVSLELMYHRKPTVIGYKTSLSTMMLQAIFLNAKFITLVNLIGTDDIKKKSWCPYDPDAVDAEQAVMPEYLTRGDKSEEMAAHVVRWLTDEDAYQTKVDRLTELSNKYSKSGATRRAADYILAELGVSVADNVPNEIQSKSANSKVA